MIQMNEEDLVRRDGSLRQAGKYRAQGGVDSASDRPGSLRPKKTFRQEGDVMSRMTSRFSDPTSPTCRCREARGAAATDRRRVRDRAESRPDADRKAVTQESVSAIPGPARSRGSRVAESDEALPRAVLPEEAGHRGVQ